MNNERYNQIVDEAYRNYGKSHWTPPENTNSKLLGPQLWSVKPMQYNKESFIHEIKTNPKFSEKWGLKIEERELSLEERHQIHTDNVSKLNGRPMYVIYDGPESERVNFYDEENIPTKLITVTYKDEKIEVYE